MKKIFINLKDWFNLEENINFLKGLNDIDAVVFPSMPYLHLYANSNLEIGTQNISPYESGPHTGEISGEHLKDYNIKWVILNHKENSDIKEGFLAKKIQNSIKENFKTIICINEMNELHIQKIVYILKNVENLNSIYFAYEPADDIPSEKSIEDIKNLLTILKRELKNDFKMIFGGNISASNIVDYLDNDNIFGFLISRNALDVEKLKTIINLVK